MMRTETLILKLLFFSFFLFSSFSCHVHARHSHSVSQPMSPSPLLPTQSPYFPPISAPSPAAMPSFAPTGSVINGGSGERRQLSRVWIMVIILVPSVIVLSIISTICICCACGCVSKRSCSRKSRKNDALKAVTLGPILSKFNSLKSNGKKGGGSVVVMEYGVLESATGNFNTRNILGQGGFGCVYKAKLDNNLFAAVKVLDNGHPDSLKEFKNEVELMSRIRHQNLVSLLGFCIHGETRLLVYEYMQNGSLETQLHGSSHGSALTWYMRMKIALDTARGLEYLHEVCNPRVIHRDLKSSNVLLDSNFNAKLSDFGLAVTMGNENNPDTKLSGTLGYVAPEYILDGKLTEKSDVYAFGVVLLELLIGRKPIEKMATTQCQSVVSWAMPQLTDRDKLPTIVDPVIRNTMDLKHLYQVAAVAVLCVQPEPSYRPLITDVLHSLIPLVPVELGGTLRVSDSGSRTFDVKPRTSSQR